MSRTKSARIQDHFADLSDPRRREVTCPPIDVVAIALCAVICGADDFVAIADFGKARRERLARFLDLSNGIPSHDRFNAIFAALKPEEFEACLPSWITALHEITGGQVVAIDGETLRRSFDAASGEAAIDMVSVWATANRISLGQVVVDQKSNENAAIPELLEALELSGALVAIDAMGCQVEIAERIIKAGADHCLAVKANQPTLHQGIVDFFTERPEDGFAGARARRHETHERGHGREEWRFYTIRPVPEGLPDGSRWAGLKAIGVSITDAMRDGKNRCEARALGDRVDALAAGRDVRRGPGPHATRTCGRELQRAEASGSGAAEGRDDVEGRHQESAAEQPGGMRATSRRCYSDSDLRCNRPGSE